MHSLEPEYLQLNAAGLMDEADTTRAVALQRGTVFSIFEELRFALYGAVAAITTGVGLLVKNNLDRIGAVTLIVALAVAAAICYASAIRTHIRGETRSLGGDYVLLLGALIVSADLGYAESQFHWLGAYWSWHLLILATLHAVTAYALNSRLVLSAALSALAGWFGIENHNLLQWPSSIQFGTQALLCTTVILIWRGLHQNLRRRLITSCDFAEVFEHFAANIGFWGALALCLAPTSMARLAGFLFLIALAAVALHKGLRDKQEAFVVYGVVYTALGLCILEAEILASALLAPMLLVVMLELATVIAAVVWLWRLHANLKTVNQ